MKYATCTSVRIWQFYLPVCSTNLKLFCSYKHVHLHLLFRKALSYQSDKKIPIFCDSLIARDFPYFVGLNWLDLVCLHEEPQFYINKVWGALCSLEKHCHCHFSRHSHVFLTIISLLSGLQVNREECKSIYFHIWVSPNAVQSNCTTYQQCRRPEL